MPYNVYCHVILTNYLSCIISVHISFPNSMITRIIKKWHSSSTTTVPLFLQKAHNLSSNKIPVRLPIPIVNTWLEQRNRVNVARTHFNDSIFLDDTDIWIYFPFQWVFECTMNRKFSRVCYPIPQWVDLLHVYSTGSDGVEFTTTLFSIRTTRSNHFSTTIWQAA